VEEEIRLSGGNKWRIKRGFYIGRREINVLKERWGIFVLF
jgi:hypothetical protein